MGREDLAYLRGVDDLCVFTTGSLIKNSLEQKGREKKKGRESSNLFLDIHPFHPNHASQQTHPHKVIVPHQLGGGERREGVDQEFSPLFKVPDDEVVESLVDFQSVSSVPVSSFGHQATQ